MLPWGEASKVVRNLALHDFDFIRERFDSRTPGQCRAVYAFLDYFRRRVPETGAEEVVDRYWHRFAPR